MDGVKKTVAKFGTNIAARLDLPVDAVFGNSHIELLSNRELTLEGHGGVLGYDENEVKLSLGSAVLSVVGSGLQLKNLSAEGATVIGVITKIEFC